MSFEQTTKRFIDDVQIVVGRTKVTFASACREVEIQPFRGQSPPGIETAATAAGVLAVSLSEDQLSVDEFLEHARKNLAIGGR